MRETATERLERAGATGTRSLFPDARTRVTVGAATCGLISGAQEVLEAVRELAGGGSGSVMVVSTGCIGLCQEEPILTVMRPGGPVVFYGQVEPAAVTAIIDASQSGDVPGESALAGRTHVLGRLTKEDYGIGGLGWEMDPGRLTESERHVPDLGDHPFFSKQVKIVLRNCGMIDPDSIEEYIARGGYATMTRLLRDRTDPEAVIALVTESGLRGRGGGGYPTGRKWRSCREAPGEPKYVICNADEGDPGAYMDRSILEGDPHAVIEGMMIGAYAIGATQGYIYVRHEYPLAVERLRRALEAARRLGFIGAGGDLDFDVKVVRGGGAFVCGESSALMASLEGNPGEPRAKFIHTVESGVWGKPSNLNNVETWANVPPILARGAEWFRAMGTAGSKGTKVFSIVGKIRRTGLAEVPMGITLREMVFDVGGGSASGKSLKAVQTGGPSGGAIPISGAEREDEKSLLDLPVDFDELSGAGSMMGSGGMIVMDEETCMVDVARYFTGFLVDESCGKCSTCREGLKQMLWLLEGICRGTGSGEDMARLERLARMTSTSSLCQLGGTAANPLLSTLRHFREEYDEHIGQHACRALVCKDLVSYEVDENLCTACRICARDCPAGAIEGAKGVIHRIDQKKCTRCGVCFDICEYGSVTARSGPYSATCRHTKTKLRPVKECH